MEHKGLKELLRDHIKEVAVHNLSITEYEQAVRLALQDLNEIKNTGK